MKSYGISTVTGDNYAKAWPQEAFRRHGIVYRRADQVRSDIYLACAPLIRSGRVELLDCPKCITQFATLERKTSPAGRDQVNHPPGGRDDMCNACAGAVVAASSAPAPLAITVPFVAERPRGFTTPGLPPVVAPDYYYEDPLLARGPEYSSGGDALAQFRWRP
jgi:hypothetical protein